LELMEEWITPFKHWTYDERLSPWTFDIWNIQHFRQIVGPRNLEGTILEFIPEQEGRRRLIFIVPKDSGKRESTHTDTIISEKTSPSVSVSDEGEEKKESTSEQTGIIIAKKGDAPDVYHLKDGSKDLGIGAIRKLTVSKSLREAGDNVRVEIQWSDIFKKYEIIRVLE